MHTIQIHKLMNHLIYFLYCICLWHHGDKPTAREFIIKWCYFVYYFLFLVALTVGALTKETVEESMFTADAAIIILVLVVKFLVIVWKQKDILVMLNRLGEFSIRHNESYTLCTSKLENFMKIVVVFLGAFSIICVFVLVVAPLLGSERYLVFKIAFPLDWKNNTFAYCMVNCFIITETLLTIVPLICSTVIWYLMICCALKYEVLAKELKCIGRIVEQKKAEPSRKEMHSIFLQDLKMAIDYYKNSRGSIEGFQSFSSNLFFVQFCTSGVCICASTYCLAFNIGENMAMRIIFIYTLWYNLCELFMITYFGNEIMLSSNSLSYSLFESQWIEQPLLTKKYVIIFGEHLKQPHKLLIGKMYPLTLETFNKVLNSAYSMFNILKNT